MREYFIGNNKFNYERKEFFMKRNQFSNKLGFILTAAGSAVGLGNIWRFPYLAAQYGGGMFLLTYILLVITFGATIMIMEIAIGRKTGLSPIGAFKKLKSKFAFIGYIESICPFLIYTFYGVISGWVLKYCVEYVRGNVTELAQDTYFSNYIAQPIEPVFWQIVFVVISSLIVIKGVKEGLERVSKIVMPILVILTVGISIYCLTLPNAMAGVKYFLIPNFEHFSIRGVLAALSQMFYSMSLAMGVMITYGSYLDKDTDIEKSAGMIEYFDTGIAIFAGLMIIPAVFSFNGGEATALNQGPGLIFVTLPKIFESIWGGRVIGALFFLLVAFAALTSLISIMEVAVASLTDQLKMNRTKAAWLVTIVGIILGIPSSLGYGVLDGVKIFGFAILDFIDFFTSSLLLPISALATCILIAFVTGTDIISDEVKLSSKFKKEKLFKFVTKYVAPVFLTAILISSILSGLGIITL